MAWLDVTSLVLTKTGKALDQVEDYNLDTMEEEEVVTVDNKKNCVHCLAITMCVFVRRTDCYSFIEYV